MLYLRISLLVLLIVSDAARAGADECFAHAAQRRHINVNLLRAIAKVESDYRPHVTNADTGAIGEMQVMPWHLKWLQKYDIYERDLYDECTNINVGAFILSDFMRMYGNTWRAVGAYGAGISPNKEQARIGYAKQVQNMYERITRQPVSHQTAAHPSKGVVSEQPTRPTMVVQQ